MLGLGHGRGAGAARHDRWGSRDGTVLAYRLDVIQDSGAYPSTGAVLPFMTKLMGPGTYDIASAVGVGPFGGDQHPADRGIPGRRPARGDRRDRAHDGSLSPPNWVWMPSRCVAGT
jgi:hypothetical protein